jgi:salicylate hydroxylase
MRVLIVGAGIGGLAAALALRRAGHQVGLFERAPELGEVGAGLTLFPNAMRALRHLGLAESVTAAGSAAAAR